MKHKRIKVNDISKNPLEPLDEIRNGDLMDLVYGKNSVQSKPVRPLTQTQKSNYESSFDGVSAIGLARPETLAEEQKLVQSFLRGLNKLLTRENNWTFLQPLVLSLEYCARCLACSEKCPVFVASGRKEIYRPVFRSEVLRRIAKKYLNHSIVNYSAFTDGDIDLNWTTIARLAESAYRCTICRRCTQACARGVDNGLITHELRKLFSQEMGIVPKELHKGGTVQQLKIGASTGINPTAFSDIVQFMEEEIEEKTGKKVKIPVDKKGADILLIHNSGEYLSWMENPEAFAVIFDAAGLDWTLSSELGGYEATNYGVWYDDIQFARIVSRQLDIGRQLKVKKIVIGECGHAHKASIVTADRLMNNDNYLPRESCMPLLEDIVFSGILNLDPKRNDFPVTLHDPCNMVRLMGIVKPQRRIVNKICTQFREMEPHGVDNYCCGGGSGFAIMSQTNFPDWKMNISGRMKVKQILDAFQNVSSSQTNKYICAPCSNCKGQIRDLLSYYGLMDQYHIQYGGLVELIVNAMKDLKQPFINWNGES